METSDNKSGDKYLNVASIAGKVAQNTGFVFLAAVISVLGAIGTSIILARLLQPTLFGTYKLYLEIIGFAQIFALLGLPAVAQKYISEAIGAEKETDISSILRHVLKIEIFVSIAVVLLLVAISPLLAGFYKDHSLLTYLIIGAIGLIPLAFQVILQSAIQGFQKFEYITISSLIRVLLSLTLYTIALLAGFDITGIIVATIIVNIVIALYFLFLLREKTTVRLGEKTSLNGHLRKRIRSYNIGLAINSFLDRIVWGTSAIFFLGVYATAAQVGFYGLGFALANTIMCILPSSLTTVLLPIISKMYGGKDEHGIRWIYWNSTRYLMFIAIPMCIGGIILAQPLVELFYGSSYLPAVIVFQITAVSFCLAAIAGSASTTLYATERQIPLVKLVAMGAAFNILLYFLLIPRYGIVGAAIASSVAQLFESVGTIVLIRSRLRFGFPFSSLGRILLATIVMAPGVFAIYHFLSGVVGLILAIIAGIILYTTVLILARALNKEDAAILQKLGQRMPGPFRRITDRFAGIMAYRG